MKALVRTTALAAAAMLWSVASYADQRDFAIVNATGYPIKFIGVNRPGDNVWNENELDGVLQDGKRIVVKFDSSDEKGCDWNLKVTWADDNTSSYFRKVNLCKVSVVTLHYDRKSDTASYKAQ